VATAATLAAAGALGPRGAAAQGITPVPLPQFLPHVLPVTDGGATADRTFLAHVPLPLGLQQGPLPAVIVFHGGGQDASRMVQHWQAMVGQFVIVCPNALFDPLAHQTLWRVARVGEASIPTIDLAFVDALLEWLRGTGRVDMNRIYAAGFSSGAVMTWQLTMLDRFVDRFRGFAPVSHTFNTSQVALADPRAMRTPKPLAYAHGTADPNWSQTLLDVPQPTPPDVVLSWITRNRTLAADPPVLYSCGVGAGPNPEPRIDPFAVEQLYRPDPAQGGGAAICFVTLPNSSHQWPLTGTDPTGRRLVSHDLDWTKRVVAFWNSFAGMGLPATPDWRQC
jgi:poly(3-hydroxybutyrate) depolymerase